MKKQSPSILSIVLISVFLLAWSPYIQTINTDPPDQPVKLIFIHHSTGENWLTDGYGDLGINLAQNNYFVSDTNYGWGPDAIGDRTDIPNWTEWFASESTPTYLSALFQENNQNSNYTRTFPDPGGENTIIMFKSCFPNSDLSGNPNDPAGDYEDLTVSGAKYVYNTILATFAAHPDKLFIIITAPPLSDSTNAANARAFNQWLLNDWLIENNYPYQNVAVFDFYNILTDKSAHHRVNNGELEYIQGGRNTLAYPSDDDHPSVAGSQKATEEFIPMLNYFYNRWMESNPPQSSSPSDTQSAQQPSPSESSSFETGLISIIDNFENQAPQGTSGWEAFSADNAQTTVTCSKDTQIAQSGSASLQFHYDVDKDSWATCGIYYDQVQDWSSGDGISFQLHAEKAGLPYHVDVYSGVPGARTTYLIYSETPEGSDSGWSEINIMWAQILGADWEETPGTPIDPTKITGFSLGIQTTPDDRMSGTIWIDELSLIGSTEVVSQPMQPEQQTEADTGSQPGLPNLPCIGSMLFILLTFGLFGFFQRR